MLDFNKAFENIRKSDLNARVGGSDPEEVANFCLGILSRYVSLGQDAKILDFGCGAGRVMLSVLRHSPNLKKIVGIDIMPDAIDFCRNNIGKFTSKAQFELLSDNNDHYKSHTNPSGGKSRSYFESTYADFFDSIYAFSVFTHIDEADFESLLRFVGATLAPEGKFLFTAFLLTPFSREKIKNNDALFKFERPSFSDDESVFVGDTEDKLAFIAYDLVQIEQMAKNAGLIINNIEYGTWRGSPSGSTLQDVVVCSRNPE